MMMMLRIYEHLRVSLVSVRRKYYATEESTRIHTKKLWHVYPFYALKFRINFNNKKMCMRTSWTSTVGGRIQWINWIFLHFTTFWIEFIYFLLAFFMVEFLDCLHKYQADKLYLNFWGIFTRLKWMKCHSSIVCNPKYLYRNKMLVLF